uniref:Aminopeptidase n=1 Tax=Rhabditophanes sp. KR3021 TaxID=114890 RepID=A0AC35TN85_9BILA
MQSRIDNIVTKTEDINLKLEKMTNNLQLPNIKTTDLSWTNYRLNDYMSPISYDLFVYPNLDTMELKGKVTIEVKVIKPTNLIVIHGSDMTFTDVKILVASQPIKFQIEYNTKFNQFIFVTKEELKEGKDLTIEIDYIGHIQKNFKGLYISTDHHADGTKSRSAFTQLAPIDARFMFPCFDEPIFKAVFKLSVQRKTTHSTVSNQHLLKTETIEGNPDFVIDHFNESVKMSTYLLALGVLEDYSHVSITTNETKSPLKITLFAPTDMIEGRSALALEVAAKSVAFFEKYFDIPYDSDKLDLVALSDFTYGAMENNFAVFFRTSMLLYNPKEDTKANLQMVTSIICHEVSHMWFGNKVTMKFWEDLYLNEGFAKNLEKMCANHVLPDHNIPETIFEAGDADALKVDAFKSSMAVSAFVNSDEAVVARFDPISYKKGSSIIQSVRKLCGEEQVRKALNEYINTFKYANAESEDLWKVIQKYAPKDMDVSISDFAKCYLVQAGYPMLKTKRVGDKVEVTTAGRYLYLNSEEDTDSKWNVPVFYTTSDNKSGSKWLKASENTIELPINEKWYILNDGIAAYFRVLYSTEEYTALAKQLVEDSSKISAMNKMMLINDAFNFAYSGDLSISVALDLIKFVQEGKEDNTNLLSIIINRMSEISNLMIDSDFDLDDQFMVQLLIKQYMQVDWEKIAVEPPKEIFTSTFLKSMCSYKTKECAVKAMNYFNNWLKDEDSIPSMYIELALAQGLREGKDSSAFNAIYAQYKKTRSPHRKAMYMIALTKAPRIEDLKRALQMSLSPDEVPINLLSNYLVGLLKNKKHHHIVWNFMKEHFEIYHDLMKDDKTILFRFIEFMVESFSTEEKLSDVKYLIKKHQVNIDQRIITKVENTISKNIQWRHHNEKNFTNYVINFVESKKN